MHIAQITFRRLMVTSCPSNVHAHANLFSRSNSNAKLLHECSGNVYDHVQERKRHDNMNNIIHVGLSVMMVNGNDFPVL